MNTFYCEQTVILSTAFKSQMFLRPRKKDFVSCIKRSKKYRVGRSENYFFLDCFFVQKCVFNACFTLIGSREGCKNFRVGIF